MTMKQLHGLFIILGVGAISVGIFYLVNKQKPQPVAFLIAHADSINSGTHTSTLPNLIGQTQLSVLPATPALTSNRLPSVTDRLLTQVVILRRGQASAVTNVVTFASRVVAHDFSVSKDSRFRSRLTEEEEELLRTWFILQSDGDEKTLEVARICVKNRFTRNEILELLGHTPVTNGEALTYPYRPSTSNALTFDFDKKGNMIEAGLVGRPPPLLSRSGVVSLPPEVKPNPQNKPR
jgi:hypothetical protein